MYRYFRTTDDLLIATAIDSAASFLDRIEAHLGRGELGPADAVVEALAFTLEQLPAEPYVSLMLTPGRVSIYSWGVTSEPALVLGRSIVERFPVDWAAHGYGYGDLDGLVEQMLRMAQSFVVDPGNPPRTGSDLRSYLHRWLGTAVAATAAGMETAGRSV